MDNGDTVDGMGVKRDLKNLSQDIEAKAKTAQDKAEGKTTSETWNNAKIKARDVKDSL
jgi:hypothetical protein